MSSQLESLTFDKFKNAITYNGYPEPSLEQYTNFTTYAGQFGRIETLQEAAMCLARLLHEPDRLRAKREYRSIGTNCEGEYRYEAYDVAGQYYYGRGYIQLTWSYNYRDASIAIFGDERLKYNPDLVAQDDTVAWKTSFWFWGDRVHNQPGVQEGKFGATTKAINGGIECSYANHPVALRRFEIYKKVHAAFGVSGEADSSGGF